MRRVLERLKNSRFVKKDNGDTRRDEKIVMWLEIKRAADGNSSINLNLTHNIPAIFPNLKNCDLHHIVQESGAFGFNIKVKLNEIEKYMSFMLGKHLFFIDRMQFIISTLDSLIEKLSQNNFKFLSEEFYGKKLELVRRKTLYGYKHMESYEKFKEGFPEKNKFCWSLSNKNISDENYEHAVKAWKAITIRSKKKYCDL